MEPGLRADRASARFYLAMGVGGAIYHVDDMPDREHASLCSRASAWKPGGTWPTSGSSVGQVLPGDGCWPVELPRQGHARLRTRLALLLHPLGALLS
ncbi:hypothetical protein RISK_006401 [Rhodopirellula islandica]|uniref:Uncharacterized protein n=1 Tax=Rhodopirellula islandica TaxID=595434 RepID=A0A0J1E7W0_RHOIS|nr:hypothetical protein RISK_006401 [Rhodopirellula islandica]